MRRLRRSEAGWGWMRLTSERYLKNGPGRRRMNIMRRSTGKKKSKMYQREVGFVVETRPVFFYT